MRHRKDLGPWDPRGRPGVFDVQRDLRRPRGGRLPRGVRLRRYAADEILRKNGKVMIPDVYINAGGVVSAERELPSGGQPSLPVGFEQAHAGGHRNVQALDRAGHRNPHEFVAMLER